MVEDHSGPATSTAHYPPQIGSGASAPQYDLAPPRRTVSRRRFAVVGGALVGTALLVLVVVHPGNDSSARGNQSAPVPIATGPTSPPTPSSSHARPEVATPVTVPTPTPTTQSPSPSTIPVSPPMPAASVASMVQTVENAGIDPGRNWSWNFGDAAEQCGARADTTVTGCTSWASGSIRTEFSGSPSLALVAHEMANAETENDAVPSLLSEATAAEGGTSWSSTDAVASCLVFRFLGFQDEAAGTWQCPAALAASVAEHIHDTVTTTRMTAICGSVSKVASTLTFTAGSGTLTVTAPTGAPSPGTVPADTPITVSGVGTFTAVDLGGTVGETGVCTS
jgi:hypothetical protein